MKQKSWKNRLTWYWTRQRGINRQRFKEEPKRDFEGAGEATVKSKNQAAKSTEKGVQGTAARGKGEVEKKKGKRCDDCITRRRALLNRARDVSVASREGNNKEGERSENEGAKKGAV